MPIYVAEPGEMYERLDCQDQAAAQLGEATWMNSVLNVLYAGMATAWPAEIAGDAR